MVQQKRPVIKFSHIYPKLLDEHNDMVETATLLMVSQVKLEELHPSFLAYDTHDGEFPLPRKGIYLMLLFLKPPGCDGICAANLFTTLRRSTVEKTLYYTSLVGREFEVRWQASEPQR